MLFEQSLKKILKENLKEVLDGYNVIVSNDINHNQFKRNDVVFCIKTGQGIPSRVEGIVATNLSVIINFKCETNALQDVLSKLNDYVNAVNGVYLQTDDMQYMFQLGLNTPSISTNTKEDLGTETIYVSYGTLIANAFYSNMPIQPTKKKMIIDDIEMEIEGIQNFQDSVSYNYTLSPSIQKGKANFDNKNDTITISLLRTNTTFCNFVMSNKDTEVLDGKAFVFMDGETRKHVVFSSITLNEMQGIPTVTIVMQGVD